MLKAVLPLVAATLCCVVANATEVSKLRTEVWTTVAEESFENHPGVELPWGKWDSVPVGWSFNCGGKAKVEIVDDNYPDSGGGKCLKLEQAGPLDKNDESKSTAMIAVRLPWKNPKAVEGVRISFNWKVSDNAGGWNFIAAGQYPESGPKLLAGATLALRDNRSPVPEYLNYTSAITSSYRRIPCCQLPANSWNETVVVFRPPYNKYTAYVRSMNGELKTYRDLSLNGSKVCADLPPNFFMLGAWHYDIQGSLWVDNFKVEVLSAQPECFSQALNPPRPRLTTADFIQKAPAIDGKLDEPVWKNAEAATAFTGWQGSKATQTTKAYVAYDTDNLYVAFDNCDSHPASIRGTVHAPNEHDHASWEDDIVELFVQLGPNSGDYAQFAVSAGGAGFEFSNIHRKNFNPEWTWSVGRSDHGWTAEMSIPWKQLSTETDSFHWPPVSCENWGINFHRYTMATDGKETTLWNPMTKNKGFHDPRNMGLVKFLPPSMAAVSGIESVPQAADGKLSLLLSNPGTESLQATLSLKQTSPQEKPLGENASELPAKGEVLLTQPVSLHEGDGWLAEVRVSDIKESIFYIKGKAELNREQQLRTQLKLIIDLLVEAESGLQSVEVSRKTGLLASLGVYKAEAEATLSLLDKRIPSFEDSVAINSVLQTFSGDVKLKGILNLARYITQDAAAEDTIWKRKYLLTQTSSMEPVYPESICADDACKGISLELAANEMRSFQIQLVAPWEPLSKINVEAGALRSASGAEIAAKQLRIRQVGYLHCPNSQFSNSGTGTDRRWFPEPLVDNALFDVKPGLSRTLWVSVDVPAGTPPGDYAGIIRVSPEGKPATEVPLNVKVWDFTLPETPTLRVWSWFAPKYGPLNLLELKNYEDLFREYSRYKQGLDGNPGEIKMFKNSEGRYRFDFSELDPYYETAFRYGTRSFNMAIGWHDELRGWLSGQGKLPQVTLPDGKTEDLRLFPAGDPRIGNAPIRINKRWAEAPFEEPMRPIYEQLLKALAAHLKEKGWYQYAHFEALDEPENNDFYTAMYRNRKTMVPDLPLMSLGVGPSFTKNIGINSVWAPAVRDLSGEIKAMRERKSKGDTSFTYICGGIIFNQNRNSPDVYVWEPPIDRRVLGWMSWKWELEGYFVFASNFGWRNYQRNAKQLNNCGDWNPWPYDSNPASNESPEIGQFIYLHEKSSGQWTWIPSVRLDNWRDGIEDYEYLYMVNAMMERLAHFSGSISEVERKRLIAKAQVLLNLEDMIPGNDLFVWNHDPQTYQARRHSLGEWIDTVSKLLKRHLGK